MAGFEGIPSWTDDLGAQYSRYIGILDRRTPDFQTKLGYPKASAGKANLSMSTNQVAERFQCPAMTLEMPYKDLADAPERLELLHELCPLDFTEYVISATQETGLQTLRDAIYRAMDVVRVYTKLPSAKQPDYDRPFTVRRGSTLLDLAGQVHKDYVEQLKFARVWGTAVHDATAVKGDYVMHDKDVVELHM